MTVFRRMAGLLTIAYRHQCRRCSVRQEARAPAPAPPPPPHAAPATPPPAPPPPAPPPAPPGSGRAERGRDLQPQDARAAERRASAGRRLLRSRRVVDSRRCARPVLQKNAEWMKRWTSTRISVEGHCDERGSARIQPRPRRSPRQRGPRLPGQPRHRRRSDRGRQQGQGIAVLHGEDRSMLAAEPARPLRHYGEVASFRRIS